MDKSLMKPQSLPSRTKTECKSEAKMNEANRTRVRRKCLDHPAMECPTPNEPCIFTKTKKLKEIKS
jgi:hypothetical protein